MRGLVHHLRQLTIVEEIPRSASHRVMGGQVRLCFVSSSQGARPPSLSVCLAAVPAEEEEELMSRECCGWPLRQVGEPEPPGVTCLRRIPRLTPSSSLCTGAAMEISLSRPASLPAGLLWLGAVPRVFSPTDSSPCFSYGRVSSEAQRKERKISCSGKSLSRQLTLVAFPPSQSSMS